MESLIHHQLYKYLETHDLVNPAQSGFHPLHNTQDVILKTIDDWKIAVDGGNMVGTMMVDPIKALDVIDHSLLLDKLGAYGMLGPELKWFTGYLHGRKQRVALNGISVQSGVM